MIDETYPEPRKAALAIQGISKVLLKDMLDSDTVEGYEPLSTHDREGLYLALNELSGRLVMGPGARLNGVDRPWIGRSPPDASC